MKRKNKLALICLFACVMAGCVTFLYITIKQPVKEWFLSGDVYHAVEAGDAFEVERLLQRGANPNRFGAGGLVGGTPIKWAIQKRDVKILNVLIKHGANLNQGDNGWTPLDIAIGMYEYNLSQRKDTKDIVQVIKLLKQAGATKELNTHSAIHLNP